MYSPDLKGFPLCPYVRSSSFTVLVKPSPIWQIFKTYLFWKYPRDVAKIQSYNGDLSTSLCGSNTFSLSLSLFLSLFILTDLELLHFPCELNI